VPTREDAATSQLGSLQAKPSSRQAATPPQPGRRPGGADARGCRHFATGADASS